MSEIFRNPANDDDYTAFLRSKEVKAPRRGMSAVPALSSHLKPIQAHCVAFALESGGSGCFLDTGLGKTLAELEFLTHAADASNGKAALLAPLTVGWQIHEEAKRFGYRSQLVRAPDEVREGINIFNYDIRDKFDLGVFGAGGLDESSIIKNFTGKTTRDLIDGFAGQRWKIAATATPAPNDHMEIGTHAEFLEVMHSNEMLSRFFINDTSTASQNWRLKGHAETAFWDWMASWARMATLPSDLGFDDTGYILPPLNIIPHRVDGGTLPMAEGMFSTIQMNATNMHQVKRATSSARATAAVEIAAADRDAWVLWVDTDYEADAVRALMPDAVEVRGSMTASEKETNLRRFADGSKLKLITKPSICAYGLNFQFCHRTGFVGRSFSYELFYQAVRRFWRFGQINPVDVHLFLDEGEKSVGRVIDRKADDHLKMKVSMRAAMRRAIGIDAIVKSPYNPQHQGRMPGWLSVA
nr:hypothetical protein [uncultured Dongia sp.]